MLDGNVLLRQKRDEVPKGTLSCPDQNLADFHHYRHYEGLRLLPTVCDSKLIQQTLIIQQKESFPFHSRNRRPPKDAVNAMLSLAYTLIANDTTSALETVGLDPYVGFMHTLRPGRPSLSLDLMEELRAYMGDRFVLSLINRKQITASDFMYQGEEGVILTDNGRKIFLSAWQNRKKEEIVHPYLGEKIPIGLIPYAQAMLLARYIRNDIDDYPVFLIR